MYPALLADDRSNDYHGFRLHHHITNFVDAEAANIEQWILKKATLKKVFRKNDEKIQVNLKVAL